MEGAWLDHVGGEGCSESDVCAEAWEMRNRARSWSEGRDIRGPWGRKTKRAGSSGTAARTGHCKSPAGRRHEGDATSGDFHLSAQEGKGSVLGEQSPPVNYLVLVISNSLQPHGLQHTRLPCPSLSPGVCSDSCPLSQCCHPPTSSSIASFSSCPQSCPAPESYPVSWLFVLHWVTNAIGFCWKDNPILFGGKGWGPSCSSFPGEPFASSLSCPSLLTRVSS